MKKFFKCLMPILQMAVLCACIVSCGDDNDETIDDAGKTPTGQCAQIGGNTYALTYGWWSVLRGTTSGPLYLQFTNYDQASGAALPSQANTLMLVIPVEGEVTGVVTGTFTAEAEFYNMDLSSGQVIYHASARGSVTVTIAPSAGGYTVTIPQSTLTYRAGEGDTETATPFTFSFTGAITRYAFVS